MHDWMFFSKANIGEFNSLWLFNELGETGLLVCRTGKGNEHNGAGECKCSWTYGVMEESFHLKKQLKRCTRAYHHYPYEVRWV